MTATTATRRVDTLIDASRIALTTLTDTAPGTRARWLHALADQIDSQATEIAADITADTGKPAKWAAIEAERAASIVRLAAAEAVRVHPDAQRLDAQPSGIGRLALTVRHPRGVILALSPFNFPVHLTVHKIAPALAVGAPIIVVPSHRTPRTVARLQSIFAALDLPDGAVTILDPTDDHTHTWELIGDPRIQVVSITGSDAVGWRIVDAVPRKHVITELGSNAAAVLAPDYVSSADLAYAAQRIALFAFYNAGQACTSVQRVYVPHTAFDEFTAALVEQARVQSLTDDVGPLIDDAAAQRVHSWIEQAATSGATIAAGGTRNGRFIAPTVLLNPPADARVITDEVFGPVVSVLPYRDFDDAVDAVNASRFGLSIGLFTRDISLALASSSTFDAGQIVIGDAPTYRSDLSSFGGVKDSGQGREGVRAAIEDYTHTRTIVLAQAAL